MIYPIKIQIFFSFIHHRYASYTVPLEVFKGPQKRGPGQGELCHRGNGLHVCLIKRFQYLIHFTQITTSRGQNEKKIKKNKNLQKTNISSTWLIFYQSLEKQLTSLN